jgi:hypothetical protein
MPVYHKYLLFFAFVYSLYNQSLKVLYLIIIFYKINTFGLPILNRYYWTYISLHIKYII